MHELPITRSLLDLALHHAENAGGGRITVLHLEVGRLSGVIDRFVQFYWDIVTEGTPAEGSKLDFEHVEIGMECDARRTCGWWTETSSIWSRSTSSRTIGPG